jgi:hypothetical protein
MEQIRREQNIRQMPRYALRSAAAWPSRPKCQWTFDMQRGYLMKGFIREYLYGTKEWTDELVRMANITWLVQPGASADNWSTLYYVVKRYTAESDGRRAEVLDKLRWNFERDLRNIRGPANLAMAECVFAGYVSM